MKEFKIQILENRTRFIKTLNLILEEDNLTVEKDLETALSTLQYTCAHNKKSEILDKFSVIYNSYNQKLFDNNDYLKYQLKLFIENYTKEHLNSNNSNINNY